MDHGLEPVQARVVWSETFKPCQGLFRLVKAFQAVQAPCRPEQGLMVLVAKGVPAEPVCRLGIFQGSGNVDSCVRTPGMMERFSRGGAGVVSFRKVGKHGLNLIDKKRGSVL